MASQAGDGRAALERAVRVEIEGLHDFFVDWYRGNAKRDEARFEEGLAARLAPGFEMIVPGGRRLDRDATLTAIEAGWGSNPDFAIRVANVRLGPDLGPGFVLATYEEWQRNAVNSTPPDNGRLSSVLLERTGAAARPFRWLHLQETWLPAEVMVAADYDF